MQIAVISDLHLGRGGPTDLFGHDDEEFLRFLQFLESNFERIILLGDVWETLTGADWGKRVAELHAARAHHREIAERFRRPQYTYVHGNHDYVTRDVEGAPSELVLQVDGTRLFFGHGHQGDPLIHRARWLSEFGVWLGGWLRRLRLSSLYSYFSRMDLERSQLTEKCAIQRWAVLEALHRRADVVVTGHTHVPGRRDHDSCLFLNSGTCAEGHISFLGVDTKRATYQVCTGGY